MSEERLTELLHRVTPEPPNSIDLPAMARRITENEPGGFLPGSAGSRRWFSRGSDGSRRFLPGPDGSRRFLPGPDGPRRRLVPALIAAVAIAAIAVATVTFATHRDEVGPAGGGDGAPAPTGQQTQRAKDVLERWDNAVAANPTRTPTLNPLPEKGNQFDLAIDAASIAADQLTLTVRFSAAPKPASEPCGVDYWAFAVESDHGVAVILTEKPHGKNELCPGMAGPRDAVVQLKKPLAQRAVLELFTGKPVPVTR
jgi:hypothetical protein